MSRGCGRRARVGTAEAKLIYEETVTITLDDGTPVMLVLDDKGVNLRKSSRPMKSPKWKVRRGPNGRPMARYQAAVPPPASQAQGERAKQLRRAAVCRPSEREAPTNHR